MNALNPDRCPDHPGRSIHACRECQEAIAPPPPNWRDGIPAATQAERDRKAAALREEHHA